MAEPNHPPEWKSCWPTSSSRTMSRRSQRFYTEVLGGRVAFSGPGGLTYVALANIWIIINVGGGPTDDKPEVTLETLLAIPSGSAASSIFGSLTSRPCTPNGARGVLNS